MLQALREVVRGDPLEVEPGDELLEILCAPQEGRQDLAREAEPGSVWVDATVIDARLLDLDGADTGVDLASSVVTIAHDQAVPLLVEFVLVIVDVARNLGLDCGGEHPLGSAEENFTKSVLSETWTWKKE